MRLGRSAKFAWGVLLYNLGVVLWGAYVRASGSGAGCGRHWPMCNGEVIPRDPSVTTLIEYSHRLSSGLALALVIALVVVMRVEFPARSLPRRAAYATLGLMLTEAALGAGLVLFELVAHDASTKRALSMMLHLVNTFFLLAALCTTALSASGLGEAVWKRRGGFRWALLLAAAMLIVVGMTGAVAALGDTLYPAATLEAGLAQDVDRAMPWFVRFRALHPFVAIGSGLALALARTMTGRACPSRRVRRVGSVLGAVFIAQIAIGVVNLGLLAPVSLQLVHLLAADALWLTLVTYGYVALVEAKEAAAPRGQREPTPEPAG